MITIASDLIQRLAQAVEHGQMENSVRDLLREVLAASGGDASTIIAAFTIKGEPVSKANSRRIVTMPDGKGGKRAAVVKSPEGIRYVQDAVRQVSHRHKLQLEGPVSFTARLFYESERPDLDESLLLDSLQNQSELVNGRRILTQKGVYCNDRQVREKHIYHGIDRRNPRAEVEIRPLQAQQVGLELPELATDDKPF